LAEITQLKFAQLLKRKLGLKAIDPGRVTAGTVQPIFELQDPAYAPENRADRGERLWTLSGGFSVSSGANGFNQVQVVSPVNGRATVVKRMTVSAVIPTSTNQPGLLALLAGMNMTQTPGTISTPPRTKDSRAAFPFSITTGYAIVPEAALGINTSINLSLWGMEIPPPAAATAYFSQIIDNLDIVLWPGTGAEFGIRGDTNAVAGWTWYFAIEGYEFTPDASEVSPLPP
jgi:hypothetical protein